MNTGKLCYILLGIIVLLLLLLCVSIFENLRLFAECDRLIRMGDCAINMLITMEAIDKTMAIQYVTQSEIDEMRFLFKKLEDDIKEERVFFQMVSPESRLGRIMSERYRRLKQRYDALESWQ